MNAPAPLATIDPYFATADFDEKMHQVTDKVQSFCDSLAAYRPVVYRTLEGMLVMSLGTALPLVEACWLAYEGVVLLAPKLIAWTNDFIQWVAAPANIIDLARDMQAAYNKATECKQALLRTAMPADKSWEGAAVDAYYAHIEKHNAAAADVESAVKSMIDAIRDAGTAGAVATLVAIGSIVAALIELIAGIVALTPPATPGGAVVITLGITTIGGTIAALGVFAQQLVNVVNAMDGKLDGTLRSSNFPGGQWPKAQSKALATAVENVGGWSY